MTPALTLLILSAGTIAFLHTVLGPGHFVPFVAMAKARNWTLAKTLRVTTMCGLGVVFLGL